MAAVLVFQNNEIVAMLMFQTNPLFFLFQQICIDANHVRENTP